MRGRLAFRASAGLPSYTPSVRSFALRPLHPEHGQSRYERIHGGRVPLFWFKRHSHGRYLACTPHLFLGSDVAPTESGETSLPLDHTNEDNVERSKVASETQRKGSFADCEIRSHGTTAF